MTTTAAAAETASRPALSRILTLAVTAGLLAGLAAALFNAILTEPIIDRAIAFEEAAAALEPADEAAHDHGETVTRGGQKFGLWLGWAAIGVSWGTLFGALTFLGWRRLVRPRHAGWRLAIGLGGWFALGALPFLKYPANPPAVGDPDTINERMRNFVGLELLAAAVVVAAMALAVVLIRRGYAARVAAAAGVALVLVGGAALYAVFPAAEPNDVTEEVAALVVEFRRHAFVGQMLFWAVFASAFAWLPAWRPFALEGDEATTAAPSTLSQASA